MYDLAKLENKLTLLKDRVSSVRNRICKEFDPNQPRDEGGRWTDAALGGYARPKLDEEQAAAKVVRVTNKVVANAARKLNLDPSTVNIKVVGHHEAGTAAGAYDPNTRTVTLYPRRLLGGSRIPNVDSMVTLRSTAAHELTHAKFDQLMDSTKNLDVLRKLVPYLEREGGVTDYSNRHWNEYAEAQSKAIATGASADKGKAALAKLVAIHETLAEMSLVKQHSGKEVGGTAFKWLHNAIIKMSAKKE